MPDNLKRISEITESGEHILAEHDVAKVSRLIAAQVAATGPDEMPDELGFNSHT